MSDNINLKFDDAPVSGGGASFLEILEKQLAAEKQEQCQAETDLKLSLSEKIINKNWKVRKSALEEIASKVSDLSSFDTELFSILSQILTDPHQGNLEEAVNILNLYLEKNLQVPIENQNELNTIIKLLIEKCYSSSKQALKDKSKDMIISFVEYLNNTDILVDNIINIMNSKNQKMSQGAVSITTILLSLFGSSAFNYKKLSSAMTALSDKCSPLIKQNIVEFFIELYKWIKKLLKPLYEKKVKDIIKNDIQKGTNQVDEQFGLAYIPMPTKFLGKKPKIRAGSVEKNDAKVDDCSDIEMKDETEIDIFTKKTGFDEKFIERMLKPECKWSEKRDAFEELAEMINPEKFKRKIKNTNRLNFMDMVKRLLKQPNQNVRHSIIKCLGNLSIGLGTNFTNEAKELIPIIIENFSCNKIAVTNDLINTLINFSKIIDDNWVSDALIKYGTKSNLCNISKMNLITLIERLLDSKKTNNSLNCYINTIKGIIIKYMDDHSQEIRNKSTQLMVYLKSNKYNLYSNNIIKQALNEQKIKKIEEFDKTEKKNKKDKNVKANNNINILSINENININSNNLNLNPFKKKLCNNNPSNTDLNSSMGGTSDFGGNKKKSNKNVNPRSRNDNKAKISTCVSADNILLTPLDDINLSDIDDIIQNVKQFIGENNVNLFDSKKWQEKKEGFTILNNYFMNENNSENLDSFGDYFLKFILIKNKSFKENNIIVLKESLLCIITLIKQSQMIFAKKYYNALLKLLIEKISERKIQQEAKDILENLMEKMSPKEILLTFMKHVRNKTVPILTGGATIINNLINPNDKIKENIHLYPIKEITEFCCFLENNTNNQCRNSGTNILCSLYAYMGNNIKVLLKDLKESTLKVIEEKFEKITIINDNTSLNNNASNNLIEQVFPRVDISKKITPNLIKALTEGKWAIKKDAIKSIENIIINANKQIQPKGLNDLFNAIKLNLKDSNKNIVKIIMKLIEELCEALGSSGFRQYQKHIIPGIISNFSEKNMSVKEEAIKCIEQLIGIMGFDSIGCYFPAHLIIDNFEIKNEILNILIKNKKFFSNKKEYIKEYTTPLINCLLDKNINIRNNAEKIVEEIMRIYGISTFNDAIKTIKTPIIINQIKLILNRINKNINENNEIIYNIRYPSSNKEQNSKRKENIQINISNISNDFCPNNNNYINKNHNTINNMNNSNNIISSGYKNNIFQNNTYSNNIYNQSPCDNNFINSNNIINNNQSLLSQPFQQNLINSNNICNNLNFYPMENNILSNYPQNEISNILKQMYSSDVNSKCNALNNLHTFLSNNENLLGQKNIEEILVAFNTLLSIITKNIKSTIDLVKGIVENNQDLKLLHNLLEVYYYLSNQYNIMIKLDNETIVYECYERLFIIITEKSLLSFQYGRDLIKRLNSIIMNFFNFCNATLSIISLIKIMLNYKSNTDEYGQVTTIAIKGLDKFRNFIFKLHNILDINKIFECLYHFFSEFEKTNENLIPHNINEENSLSMINSMISEFIKLYGDKIWDIYNNSLSDDLKRFDIYLKRNIMVNLREYKNNNFLLNNNLKTDMNFNLVKTNNSNNNIQNEFQSVNNNIKNENNNENIINNNNNKSNVSYEDKNDVMTYINKIKENGKTMTTEEKGDCYNHIVSLLKTNNQPISIIFTQLDMESTSKIYELYHSYDSKNSSKNQNNLANNVVSKNNNNSKTLKITFTNGQKTKQNQNISKTNNFILTEQGKRIQEYRNKYNTLTDKGNNDSSHVDIFANNNFNINNNSSNINDENKQINNYNSNYNKEANDLHYFENKKKEIDDLIKRNAYSKSVFNSQSDIPQVDTSFFTSKNILNNNSNLNLSIFNDRNNSQSSMELAKNMKIHLDHIRNNINKQNKNI